LRLLTPYYGSQHPGSNRDRIRQTQLDDEAKFKQFFGVLESILRMDRWYTTPEGYSCYGPGLFRGNVESIRLLWVCHSKDKFARVAITMVLLCWTACAMSEEMTAWLDGSSILGEADAW
jgi:hypothetical protein